MEKDSFEKAIEKKFTDYVENTTTDWTDELIQGKEETCDCCGNQGEITLHHLIPKRLLEKSDPKVGKILERQKIGVCKNCHGLLHPENIWVKNLLDIKQKFSQEAKKLDEETKNELSEKEEIVAKNKQNYNNLLGKYEQLKKDTNLKEIKIKELKKDLHETNKSNQDLLDEKRTAESMHSSDKISYESAAHIFWNALLRSRNKKKFHKEYEDSLQETFDKKFEQFFNKKGNQSHREISLLFKTLKYNIGKMPMYDEEDFKKESEKLRKDNTEIFDKIMEKTMKEFKKGKDDDK